MERIYGNAGVVFDNAGVCRSAGFAYSARSAFAFRRRPVRRKGVRVGDKRHAFDVAGAGGKPFAQHGVQSFQQRSCRSARSEHKRLEFHIRIGSVRDKLRLLFFPCYFSEIYRGGIESIPVGQYEAGKVLGLTKSQVFGKIVLLQVIKRIVPPMGNEIITLVKDTSLAQIIGVIDLLSAAEAAVNSLVILDPLLYAAVFYLVFNGALTLLFGYVEKKLNFFRV